MENSNEVIKALEVKSLVAKLMAKENISIQRGNFKTAFFDVNHRVLGLPVFASVSEDATDLMIGHEIGHALFTVPADWNAYLKLYPKRKSILNIVEDIRIERKVREEFPGLISIFRKGYKDLLANGFFGKFDVNKLAFIDRMNMNAKADVQVSFSDEEREIYDICLAVDTWEDVVNAVELVVKYIKAHQKKHPKAESMKVTGWGADYGDLIEDDGSEADELDPSEFEAIVEEEKEDEEEWSSSEDGIDLDEDDSPAEDEEEWSSSEDDIDLDEDDSPAEDEDDSPAEDEEDEEPKDVESNDFDFPDGGGANWGNHTASEKRKDEDEDEDEDEGLESETMDALEDNLQNDVVGDEFVNVIEPTEDMYKSTVVTYGRVAADRFSNDEYWNPKFEVEFKEFIDNNRKFVAMLKKEFDMKKAAYEYARSTTARRGTLDVNKLHCYKYDDNIFQTVTKLGNAKSHGMMFMIDMSGSMDKMISEVYRQTMILVMFCKAVGIPFEVYGWTNGEYFNCDTNRNINMIKLSNLRLTQLITSDMNPKIYKEALFGMFKSSRLFDTNHWRVSKYESLSGTPYIEMLTASHWLVKKFRAKHRIQNMNLMVLSDGAGSTMSLTGSTYYYSSTTYFGKLNGGKVSEMGGDFESQAGWMINNLKETTGCKVITFGLISGRGGSWGDYTNAVGYGNIYQCKIELRKNGIYCTKGHLNADLNVAVRINKHNLSNDNSFSDVNTEGMTDGQIAHQFIKTVKARKSDRVFVNEFIKIIA